MISILVPSNRPDGLDRFIESLRAKSTWFNDLDIIVVVDDDSNAPDYIDIHNNIKTLHTKPGKTVPELQHEAYKVAQGDWIFLANDDVICETDGWDKIVYDEIRKLEDNINMFYVNDMLFQDKLACFPIIHREVLELIKFFPLPYKRYKVDDTLWEVMPRSRRHYLKNVIFRHENDKGEVGFKLSDGRIYPINQEAAAFDAPMWEQMAGFRTGQVIKVLDKLIPPNVKVMIGVPTQEMARRAEFYDYLNALDKPANTIIAPVHGQSPAKNRNLIIEQALKFECTHLLFLDDDVAFRGDMLKKFLAHDVDWVTGLYVARNYPHQAFIFDGWEGNAAAYKFLGPQDTGLVPITAAGMGTILFKTEIFRQMKQPWIRLGEFSDASDMWCDDIGFFYRLKEELPHVQGYVDLDLPVGHMAHTTIWPGKDPNGNWLTIYNTNGQSVVSFPSPVPAKKPERELVNA